MAPAFTSASPWLRTSLIGTLRGVRIPQRTSRTPIMQPAAPRSCTTAVEWLSEPLLVKGAVQRGFGRGSRDLGTPTANLSGKLLKGVKLAERDGVYVGFGSVPEHTAQPVKMVANLGHNITYGDVKERVLEAFLMGGELPDDFYGKEMRLCIAGYLRPEAKFNSLQELIAGIENDIRVAKEVLDEDDVQKYRNLAFFHVSE